MTNYSINPEQDIIAIADAIRSKNGSSNTYKVNEMPEAIRRIGGESGGTVEAHVMTFDFTQDDLDYTINYPDATTGDNSENFDSFYISAQHFNEIIEYYSAGYRVEIQPNSNNNSLKYTVIDVLENLYSGPGGGYSRYSGAAILITRVAQTDQQAIPHNESLTSYTYVLRDNSVYIAEGDGMYYY